jgi:guanosine-3',5'-bis(diphosphate) 3'-pyrophosphohydrolase
VTVNSGNSNPDEFDKARYAKLQAAIDFCFDAHFGQTRDNGNFYIIHPITVMTKVAARCVKEDVDVLIAALLHDTIEDNEMITPATIQDKFGARVSLMVDVLTRYDGMKYHDYINNIIDTQDYNIILIKLMDLEHNLSTLKPNTDKKKKRFKKYQQVYSRLEGVLSSTLVDV